MLRRWTPILLLLGLTACTGPAPEATQEEPSASPSSPELDAALVTWIGGFCDGYYRLTLPDYPEVPSPSTEADRQPLLDFLGDTVSVLEEADQAAAALPQAPTEAGTELVTVYRDDLDTFKAKITEYTDNAESFPADQLDVIYRLSAMDVLTYTPGSDGITGYLNDRPELLDAANAAPACLTGAA